MGKVKVVEIENDVPAPEAPAPEAAAPEEPTSQPELSQVEETQIEAPKPTVEEKQPEPKKKQLEYVTCEVCNKSMLVKTFKYSHQKLCKPEPPPPPPTPEPKAKRVAKPKAAPETSPNPTPQPKPKKVAKPAIQSKEVEEVETQSKPTFTGVVSFKDFQPVVDPYAAMRQQRLIVRQQRVKSLISQAI